MEPHPHQWGLSHWLCRTYYLAFWFHLQGGCFPSLWSYIVNQNTTRTTITVRYHLHFLSFCVCTYNCVCRTCRTVCDLRSWYPSMEPRPHQWGLSYFHPHQCGPSHFLPYVLSGLLISFATRTGAFTACDPKPTTVTPRHHDYTRNMYMYRVCLMHMSLGRTLAYWTYDRWKVGMTIQHWHSKNIILLFRGLNKRVIFNYI